MRPTQGRQAQRPGAAMQSPLSTGDTSPVQRLMGQIACLEMTAAEIAATLERNQASDVPTKWMGTNGLLHLLPAITD